MRLFMASAILFSISMSVLYAEYTETEVITYTKQIPVSTLDPKLPKQPLEGWVKSLVGEREIVWEVNDCGESDGSGTQADVSLCGAFSVQISPGQTAGAWVSVGSVTKGVIRSDKNWPHVFRVFVEGENGYIGTDLKRLARLFSTMERKH